jgi:hypothetical protein
MSAARPASLATPGEVLPPIREEAAETLAKILFEEIEAAYPGPDAETPTWEDLSEQRRVYFRTCVETILEQPDLVITALGFGYADHDMILRCTESGE